MLPPSTSGNLSAIIFKETQIQPTISFHLVGIFHRCNPSEFAMYSRHYPHNRHDDYDPPQGNIHVHNNINVDTRSHPENRGNFYGYPNTRRAAAWNSGRQYGGIGRGLGGFDGIGSPLPPRRGHRPVISIRLAGGGECRVDELYFNEHIPRGYMYMRSNYVDMDRWMDEYAATYPDTFADWDWLSEKLSGALNVLFTNLDRWAEEGFTRMFHSQHAQLDQIMAQGGQDGHAFCPELIHQIHAMGCVCDQELGLGCSGPLGSAIMDVAVRVLQFLPPDANLRYWHVLFASVSRVLSDGPRQEAVVARVWDRLPVELKERLMRELTASPSLTARRTRRALERQGRL